MDQPEKQNTASAKGRLSQMVGASSVAAPRKLDKTAPTAGDVIKWAIIPAIPFIVLHWQLLDWLVLSWRHNQNWSHGVLIPLFSAYLIYARWKEISASERRVSWVGLMGLVAAIGLEGLFQFGPLRSFWLYGMAMVMCLFSLVLFLNGWRMMKFLWLPVLYLVLSVPMPGSLYTRIAYPLQELAASGAVAFFKLCGVGIVRHASTMSLTTVSGAVQSLTVAEACSGMHLLMAFVALGIAMAYLADRPVWQRVVLVAAGLPIAIFCNVLRVIITCFMYYIDKEELGQGVLHNFTGMLMLIPAFGMLWLLGWVMSKLFVEVDDESDGQSDESEPVAEGK